MSGERLDALKMLNKVTSEEENIDDPFQIGKRTYLDLDEKSRTFNHSCNPNAGIRKNCEMFALREIKEGEEITYDYSLTIAPTKWQMKCQCDYDKCRKILGDVTSIPKKRLSFYKKQGNLQRYMKLLIKEVEAGVYKIPKYEDYALTKLSKK